MAAPFWRRIVLQWGLMVADPFASTHWSAIMRAAGSSPEARDALSRLCEAYWFPLYAYLRRRRPPDEAEDLVQEFFASEVLTRRIFKGVDPLSGRFRAWLMASLKNFTANAEKAKAALKRGGGAAHLSIDRAHAEGRYQESASASLSPEQLYELTWAMTVLDRVRGALHERYEATGRGPLFRTLAGCLPGAGQDQRHADAARALGKSEEAVRVAAHRLRKEFGELLREEVGRTVSSSDEIDAELRDLLASFA
jgi:DNA-directed RNA polymerase specialized sigma24 family protein